MRFHVLGPLDVRDAEGRPIAVTSAKHRALLSLLLLEAGRVVSVDRIVDELWGDQPPPTAMATLQTYVSQLRRLLEPARGPREAPRLLVTRAPGYALLADRADVDALRFADLVSVGTGHVTAGDLDEARAAFEQALDAWRGEPYADLAGSAAARAERNRLEQILVAAHEQLATVRIRLGRADLAVAELETLVAEHPLNERLAARLMESLWASGRQADALGAYQRSARMLRDELGVEPGPELADLHQRVLRHELPVPTSSGPPLGSGGGPRTGAPRAAEPVGVERQGPPCAGTEPAGADGGPSSRARPAAYETGAASRDSRPLIGRDPERELIQAALSRTTRGAGSVVIVEGEAGIGKTRLAEEATAIAAAQGWQSAWARCADDAGAPALWPWSQLLEQLDLGDLHLAPGQDPDEARFALFQDVRRRLQEVSTHAPLLIVLDDIQAADTSSLQLLRLFASHLEGVRVLVVVTVRTVGEDLAPAVQQCLARLSREPRALRLHVTGLSAEAVSELLERALGTGDERLARQVHERTVGNPFFVGEFAQLVRSRRNAGDADPTHLPLPPSVREVLGGRLAALPADTLEVLRLAAAVGQEYDLPLLQDVVPADPETILTALEPALRAGVVVERERGWDWRFSHALVRETLQAGLSRLESARLHHRIATALEARGRRSAIDVGRLAHHFHEAVPVAGAEPAIRYAALAARAARDRFAHPEAAEHTQRALRLLDLLPGDTERQRHALLVDLGTDLLRSGEPFRAQEAVAAALDVARRLDDHQLMAEAAAVWGGVTLWNWRAYGAVDDELVGVLESLVDESLDNLPLRARLLGALGCELAYSDRRDQGIRYAERGVALARSVGDPALLGRTLNNVTLAAWGARHGVDRRIAATNEALAHAGRGLPARTEFFARLHRGPLLLHRGDVAGFEADLAMASRISATLTGPEVRPHVLYQEVGRAMLRGEWERAEALAREAYDLYLSASMWGAAEMCWALHQFTLRRREGRPGEAVDVLVEVGDAGVPLAQACAVVASAEAGARAQALALRARWGEQHPLDWTTDSLIVVRAWAALALGEDVHAAYLDLLPYRRHQIVVGTATACWGSYDLVLSDLAVALGDERSAVEHARDAAVSGHAVASPWQVVEAESRLARLRPSPDHGVTASA